MIGCNIGIAGTAVGVSRAMGKAIAKSNLPPLQKAGVAGDAIHVGTSVINRVVNISSTIIPPTITPANSNLPKDVNKFMNGYSDLMLLIISIDILTCIYLSLIFMLILLI